MKFKGVTVSSFAAKADSNSVLLNGLTSQANSGLYRVSGQFADLGGAAMGGLNTIDQAMGTRVTIGMADTGNLGISYMRAASSDTIGYDGSTLMGADLNLKFGQWSLGAEYAQVDTEAADDALVADIDENNTALDANIGFKVGALGIKGGWKSIDNNFTAPGFWDKLGRWTNPTNVEGPYLGLDYPLGKNMSLFGTAEMLSGKEAIAGLPAEIDSDEDDVDYYSAGLRWGMGGTTSMDLGFEWVKWDPDGLDASDEKYINIGIGHQWGTSIGLKVGYQIADFDAGSNGHSYGADYKGNLAVAQFSVKF